MATSKTVVIISIIAVVVVAILGYLTYRATRPIDNIDKDRSISQAQQQTVRLQQDIGKKSISEQSVTYRNDSRIPDMVSSEPFWSMYAADGGSTAALHDQLIEEHSNYIVSQSLPMKPVAALNSGYDQEEETQKALEAYTIGHDPTTNRKKLNPIFSSNRDGASLNANQQFVGSFSQDVSSNRVALVGR